MTWPQAQNRKELGCRPLPSLHLLQCVRLIVVNLFCNKLLGRGVERVERRHLDAYGVPKRLDARELPLVGAGYDNFPNRATGNVIFRPNFDAQVGQCGSNALIEATVGVGQWRVAGFE
jgi:hypothetical protein